jgi:dTMP kinase
MTVNTWRGKFIVFEGLDGSNSIFYAQQLEGRIKEKAQGATHLTREPSDGPVGRDIRLYLNGRLAIDRKTVAALFVADRMDHIYRAGDGILARLVNGETVICDRYALSTYAYQPLEDEEISQGWLFDLHKYCIQPDLTLFIDTPVEQCVQKYYAEKLQGAFHSALPGLDQADIERTNQKFTAVRNNFIAVIEDLRKKGEAIEIITKPTPEGIEREIRRIVEKALQL